jgi:hypothetical protein
MLPGTYTFYFATVSVERDDDDGRPVNAAEGKKLRASYQVLKTIPAAYYTAKDAGPDRKVEVTSGAALMLSVGSATK